MQRRLKKNEVWPSDIPVTLVEPLPDDDGFGRPIVGNLTVGPRCMCLTANVAYDNRNYVAEVAKWAPIRGPKIMQPLFVWFSLVRGTIPCSPSNLQWLGLDTERPFLRIIPSVVDIDPDSFTEIAFQNRTDAERVGRAIEALFD